MNVKKLRLKGTTIVTISGDRDGIDYELVRYARSKNARAYIVRVMHPDMGLDVVFSGIHLRLFKDAFDAIDFVLEAIEYWLKIGIVSDHAVFEGSYFIPTNSIMLTDHRRRFDYL